MTNIRWTLLKPCVLKGSLILILLYISCCQGDVVDDNNDDEMEVEEEEEANISFDSEDVKTRMIVLICDLKNMSLDEARDELLNISADNGSNNINLWESLKDDIKNFLKSGCREACQYFSASERKRKMEFEKKEATRILNIIRNLLELGFGDRLIDSVTSLYTKEEALLHFEPALLVIAVCSTFGNRAIRKRSFEKMSQMCFNTPRLFFFIAICDNLMVTEPNQEINTKKRTKRNTKKCNVRWDKMRKKAISKFYLKNSDEEDGALYLLFNTTRWNRRYNVTHRSVLGRCRPKPRGPYKNSFDLVFRYLTRGFEKTKQKYDDIEGILTFS